MATMALSATGSLLTVTTAIHLTSTQVEYDECDFTFDSAWDGYAKTAVFYADPANVVEVVLVADSCYIPWDAFASNKRYLYVGVYGTSGTSVLPTNFVEVAVAPGANVEGTPSTPPSESVYAQLLGMISNNASGSPAGTYADLAALNAADPDHSKIYITLDDGKWCYYSTATSAFVAGGVYQATAIADDSVTYPKLDLRKYGNLLTLASQIEQDYYYTNAGVRTMGIGLANIKIPVEPNEIIICYSDNTGVSSPGVYVDVDDAFVSAITDGEKSVVPSASGLVFRVPSTAGITHVYFNTLSAEATLSNFIAIKVYETTADTTKINSIYLSEDVVKADSPTAVVNWYKNDLFMPSCYLNGSTGAFAPGSDVGMYPPIPVTPGDVIKIENAMVTAGDLSTVGVFLDASYDWVSNFPSGGQKNASMTVPAGAVYYVATITNAAGAAGNCVIYRIATDPSMKINRNAIYPADTASPSLAGKIWVSLGDSITFQELWQPHIYNLLDLTHVNCGIGSTALAGAGATAFHQTVRLDAVIAADPDIVTILGGANDITSNAISIGTSAEFVKPLTGEGAKDTATFLGAYSKIIETLLAWKPTLRIIILGTTWAHGDGVDVRPAGSTLTYTDFSNASKIVAQYYGLPFADLHGETGFNAFTMGAAPNNIYSSDTIHPNAEGGKRMSEVVDKVFDKLFLFD